VGIALRAAAANNEAGRACVRGGPGVVQSIRRFVLLEELQDGALID